MFTDSSLEQLANAPAGISDKELGSETAARYLHTEKALFPIEVTELGRVIDFSPVQLNASFPIEVTEFGTEIDFKSSRPKKALSLILITEFGIVTDENDNQLWEVKDNALSPMATTLYLPPYSPKTSVGISRRSFTTGFM